MRVLAGDIGGTHTRLALVEVAGDTVETLERRDARSADFGGVADALRRFLAEVDRPERGCLAVPCPVRDGRCVFPNLDWTLDVVELRRAVGMERLHLVNDFSAVAWAIEGLPAASVDVLQEGRPDPLGPRAVLGAGTGLGHAYLTFDAGRWRAHESEGGHADYAPRDALECRLLLHLVERFGRASWERVISGPGLEAVYDFLVEDGLGARHPELPGGAEERAAIVSRLALEGADPVAARALDLFLSAYGAQAANFALSVQATGGVWIAGGIAPRIPEAFRRGPFLEAFRSKGRMAALVGDMPVHVVLDPDVGLRGAALRAARPD